MGTAMWSFDFELVAKRRLILSYLAVWRRASAYDRKRDACQGFYLFRLARSGFTPCLTWQGVHVPLRLGTRRLQKTAPHQKRDAALAAWRHTGTIGAGPCPFRTGLASA